MLTSARARFYGLNLGIPLVCAFSLSTGVIHYLKGHTSVYCPVETTQYAGKIEHKEWFQNFDLLKVAGDGRCWPGGHASGGFTMLALYFVARRYRWRHSKALMYGALALGFVYGTTRVLQGWHYMSHTFWAGIFVWLSCWLMALLFYGRAVLEQPVLGNALRQPERQDRVGGGLTAAVLSHHRTYGSVYGGSYLLTNHVSELGSV